MKTILHKCALNFWLLPAPARVFISKLQNRFSVFSFYVLLLFLLSTGKTSLFWEETQYTRGKMWQGFWPRFKDWDDICQFLIFFSFAFQSVPRWLCECIYLENVCIEGLLPTGRRWWSWIPLWLGGELRSLCRQQWMALSEGSARWQADLLRIHPERRDESERGASKGVREAVCVCWGGGCCEARTMAPQCMSKVRYRCTLLKVIWCRRSSPEREHIGDVQCLAEANPVCGWEA